MSAFYFSLLGGVYLKLLSQGNKTEDVSHSLKVVVTAFVDEVRGDQLNR